MSLAPCSTRPANFQSLVTREPFAQSAFLDSDDDNDALGESGEEVESACGPAPQLSTPGNTQASGECTLQQKLVNACLPTRV